MNREDAYYYKILLMNGIYDDYDNWLYSYLTTEEPLSDIVLELGWCGSDINKTISCLHNFCLEQPFNERIVCDKLRTFLKESYNKNLYTIEEICTLMYNFVLAHGDPIDLDMSIWGDMFYLDDYWLNTKDGLCSKEKLEDAVLSYLNEGTPVDYNSLWNIRKEPSLFQKIKNLSKMIGRVEYNNSTRLVFIPTATPHKKDRPHGTVFEFFSYSASGA